MSRIFVTGATGFVGSHLCPILLQDHEVVPMVSDLLDFDAVAQEVSKVNPDIIIHLAARTEVERSFYEQISFSQVNYVGSVNLIEAAAKLPKLQAFLFASTMEVYGWQPISDKIKLGQQFQSVTFDEHTTPNPNAPYAVAKLAVEKYLEYMHRSRGFPFAALRQTNTYGRKDNDFFVTEQIVSQMLTNPDHISLGYQHPFRNFLFVDDLVDAWVNLVRHVTQVNDGHIFTIGPDRPIQISAWAEFIAKKLDWQGEIKWNTKPNRPGEIYWLNSGNSLIERVTGWKPRVDYDDGIERTIDIWQRNLCQNP